MIDIKELKSRRDEIKKNIADRYMNVDLDAIIKDRMTDCLCFWRLNPYVLSVMRQLRR